MMLQRIAFVSLVLSSAALGDDDICYRDHYAQKPRTLHACPRGYEKSGLLCYKPCKSGYVGVGPVCWQHCPGGWRDDGALCNNRGGWTIGSTRSGCPWYDVCGLWHRHCTSCPPNTLNHGCTCHKPLEVRAKHSYGRGVGKPLQCADNEVQEGALCYNPCDNRNGNTYVLGLGTCWMKCTGKTPFEYGAACCSDEETCVRWGGEMAAQGIGIVAGIVASVLAAPAAAIAAGVIGAAAAAGTLGNSTIRKPYCGAINMVYYTAGKCRGRPIKTLRNQSSRQCNSACIGNASCEFSSHDVKTDMCYLYRICNIEQEKAGKYETFVRDGDKRRRLLEGEAVMRAADEMLL